jgi:hypothetical protein
MLSLVKSRVICARLPGLVLFAFLISNGSTALAATSSSQLVAKTPNAGVVLASFRNSDNAEKLMQELGFKFGADEISLGILSAQSDDRPLYRVVVQADGVDSRELLQQMRSRGFDDAWHIRSTQLSRLSLSAVRSRPAQPLGSMPTQAGMKNGLQEAKNIKSRAASGEPLLATPQRAAQPDPLAEFAGRGAQTVYGSEGGIDLNELQIQTLDHDAANVTIDGVIEEAVWRGIPYYDNMRVSIPDLGTPAKYSTKVRLFATEKGLYVSSDMEQPADSIVERITRRDDWVDRDTFGVTLDPSGEAKLGYWFWVALGDSYADGKVLPERRWQRDWDGPWVGKSARTATGWSVEMFLPWSMLDVPALEGLRNMGFAASRLVSHQNQRYQWPGYGVSSKRFVSAFNRIQMNGVQPVQKLSFIPFAAATYDEVYGDKSLRVGADFAWQPSPLLQTSGSVNPDFGAVESDDVVLNLTASETFFPEKRLFFLEGSEIFNVMPRDDFSSISTIALNGDFSTTSRRIYLQEHVPLPVSLMNTRRIGGTANQMSVPEDVTLDRGQRDVPTNLLAAAKVTGSAENFRYGLLTAIEDDVEWLARDANDQQLLLTGSGRDFAVARLSYGSPNSRSVGYMGTLVSGSQYDAGVHSIDGHLRNRDGSLKADAQLIMSDRDGVTGYGAMFDALYAASPSLRHKFEVDIMDEDVDFNDLGFLLRNDYVKARYVLMYNKQDVSALLSNYRTTLVLKHQHNLSENQITDSAILWRSSIVLPGRNTLRAGIGYFPERYEDINSRGNGAYRVNGGGWFESYLSTDAAKTVSFTFGLGGNEEDLGDWSYNVVFGLTYLPVDQISIAFDLSYRDRSGWVVHQGDRNFGVFDADEWQPSLDVNWFIAPGHQLRWNMQWAGVRATDKGFFAIPQGDGDLLAATREQENYDFNISRLTTQLRYRWEIAPLTDFYLVYNRGNSLRLEDEYDVLDLFDESLREPVIDSVVAKLRYRFSN